jgi:hypothetical protein
MSMTVVNAKIYVSRIAGGANNSSILDMASEAILRAYEDWEVATNWSFLLTDTSKGFIVRDVINTTSAVISAPSVGAFDGVNPGVTVTATGVSTTVKTVTRNVTTGHVDTIELTAAGTANPSPGVPFTFGPNIPLVTATTAYSAPANFRTRYHAKLMTLCTAVDYIEGRVWYKTHPDLTLTGMPIHYTVNYGTKELNVYPSPTAAAGNGDLLFLQYYRSYDKTATLIDIPDAHLYRFLDYAQWRLLEKKNALDARLGTIEAAAKAGLIAAVNEDKEGAQENSLPLFPLSMLLAKRYVAGALDGEADPRVLGAATEAILRAYEDWEAATNWSFLLTDTSFGFTVPHCLTASSTTLLPPFEGAFDGVNKGVTVTGTGVSTTVSAVTRTPNGHVTSLTLTATATLTSSVLGVTLTFGPNIPIASAQSSYSAPTNFRTAYHAKLLTTPSIVDYIESRVWFKVHPSSMVGTGVPVRYTVNYGTKELSVYPTPTATEVLFLQYYRSFNKAALNIDMTERNLYRFLDYARLLLVMKKDSASGSLQQLEVAAKAILTQAVVEDAEVTQENSHQNAPMSVMVAKRYVAGIINGENDPRILGQASEAILRTYQDWQAAKFWTFLLKETGPAVGQTAATDITLVAGTSDYTLPADFNGSYTARMIDSLGTKSSLRFIDQRYWDKNTGDQTLQGIPHAYTILSPSGTTATMRVFKVPNAAYVVRLRYFRSFITTGTTIDIPDEYLYKFLDCARAILLEAARAVKDPTAFLAVTRASFEDASQTDEQLNDDDDNDSRLKSPYECGDSRRPIVGNGIFDDF